MGPDLGAQSPAAAAPDVTTPATGRAAQGVSLSTAASFVAVGTSVSRLTGLLRIVALAWALGQSHLADAFNLANVTPNMLYDIVLGGVLSATFIPVFVDHLANRDERDAFESISAVLTAAAVVLLATTLAALVLAPRFITALTALDTSAHSHALHQIVAERDVATTLLRWFVIQIAAYGFFALASALLNTRRRFVAVAWAPIVNNVVCILVLVWFGLWAGRGASLATVESHHTMAFLLGLGTSLGVVLQGAALIPALRASNLGLLRWHWNLRDRALRTVVRLSGWTFGFVVANQIALFVVTLLAGTASGPDPVSSYSYAYAFLQMPYGIVAVTIMSVVTPDLSEKWATGRQAAFVTRLSTGLRALLALIIPAAVGMLLLAKPAVALLLGHGHSTPGSTSDTGAALAMFALGLPGFCAYLYIVRVLQSMQRTKVAFYLYLGENGINVALAVALVHSFGVRGLALSLSVAYTVSALVGLAILRRWFGRLGTPATWAPLRRVTVASVVMGVVVLVVSNLSGASAGVGLLLRVVASVVAGVVAYGAVAVLLGSRAAAARRRERLRRQRREELRPVRRRVYP
ncbi:MAG TPA: murein biosynthesis integral membrane protein MurJ [Acidimicrobiales bacterium]|nr:murein biosynthesis integral membrane protein MurJ [Acidimicrobiales bacterium]